MSIFSEYAFLALHAFSPHDHGRFDDVLDAYQREREACSKVEDALARTRLHGGAEEARSAP